MNNIIPQNSQIIIYRTENNETKINVRLDGDTVWLTQKMMAELFNVDVRTISEHIQNIFKSDELQEKSTVRKIRIVQKEGNRNISRETDFYSLDVIIAVGYRVNSLRATQFRQWATERLKEYLIQGFSLNEEKLKSGKSTEYFDKLQAKLREIRLSERIFYQKIKDIYATSIDYDAKDDKTIEFFKVVQNKFLWAISRETAAELVHRRSDHKLPYLGMQSFDKKDEKAITKKDVSIAKNYLNEKEIKTLGLLVE